MQIEAEIRRPPIRARPACQSDRGASFLTPFCILHYAYTPLNFFT